MPMSVYTVLLLLKLVNRDPKPEYHQTKSFLKKTISPLCGTKILLYFCVTHSAQRQTSPHWFRSVQQLHNHILGWYWSEGVLVCAPIYTKQNNHPVKKTGSNCVNICWAGFLFFPAKESNQGPLPLSATVSLPDMLMGYSRNWKLGTLLFSYSFIVTLFFQNRAWEEMRQRQIFSCCTLLQIKVEFHFSTLLQLKSTCSQAVSG